MSECPLVFIEWEDSRQPSPSWQFINDYQSESIVKCVSVGWLIHDDDNMKCVAPNMGDIESVDSVQVSGVIRIPTRCVTNLIHLDEPDVTSYVYPSSHLEKEHSPQVI